MSIALASLLLPIRSVAEDANDHEIRSTKLDSGIELHYVEAGEGVPVIFIHGTLGDLYMWTELGFVQEVSMRFRAIAYSRRYNYPNNNDVVPNQDHGTLTEAEDLAEFLKQLEIERCHIVGYSYGGYAALHFAVKHPARVRSLTLAEPPLVPWLRNLANGTQMIKQRERNLVEPANEMLSASNEEGALQVFIDHVIGVGSYEKMEETKKEQLRRNRKELFAELRSKSMFGPLKREEVGAFHTPTLMISGENSIGMLRMIDNELEKTLPAETVRRVQIPGATHGMWHENPQKCKQALMKFLTDNS